MYLKSKVLEETLIRRQINETFMIENGWPIAYVKPVQKLRDEVKEKLHTWLGHNLIYNEKED